MLKNGKTGELLKLYYVYIVILIGDPGDEPERKCYGLISDMFVCQVGKGQLCWLIFVNLTHTYIYLRRRNLN